MLFASKYYKNPIYSNNYFLMQMKQNKDLNSNKTIIKMGKYTLEYPQNHPKKKPISKEIIK